MSFIAKLPRGREVLEQQHRLSVRALGRELGLGGDELKEFVEVAYVKRSRRGEAFNLSPSRGRW